MNENFVIGVFENENDVLHAAEEIKEQGLNIYDVYTPYPIHGLEKAMGLKPSRLTYICFGLAFAGLLFALFLQFWIGSIDWPLNVGGRPFNSLPAYLPVAFELTVLFGGVGVTIVMLFRNKLFPGKSKQVDLPCRLEGIGATDDRFIIIVEQKDSSVSASKIKDYWEKYNPVEIKSLGGDEI